MAIKSAGIIFSNLNNNNLTRLTGDRTVAAIPFGCRYRLADFCLSAMVNANISNINIVANYNYRSLVEHIGSGKDWDLARRKGGITVISPFQTTQRSPGTLFSTHMEALINMKEYINEIKEKYVVLMDSDHVLNIDLKDVLTQHEKSGARVTFVVQSTAADFESRTSRMMISEENGRITDISMNTEYNKYNPNIALGIYVMSVEELKRFISRAEAYSQRSLTGMLMTGFKNEEYYVYRYEGFVAHVSSFLDYYQSSIKLATDEKSRESLLWKKDSPIFTRVHNSSPAVFTDGSSVKSSMLGDECVIEGTVINSVLFRGVRVEKGAVVKNCILFRGTHVGKGAELNCIVTDKDVTISSGVKLSGNDNMPFYINKGTKV